ncbi:hypothetical protein [Parafrankia sp. BMG5.11]|uniref:Uncharacterized protein n=1 Tax=Parafrankia soli TaxID=2599596 RepID=A0A1S1QPQ0_9ACTN|nr:hypothetical protein [Parafrankia sp. BMG5.11]OHV35549.1 hypothetical protein BBK14_15105 [Parafrankia soli]TCJ32753.1 hypothetical protein E0504_41380 [Parafrankia sp. BMG5.11]SQD98993.1 hypothetical protein FMEAI12_5070005 [Parafrankia sp. Ea1.12]
MDGYEVITGPELHISADPAHRWDTASADKTRQVRRSAAVAAGKERRYALREVPEHTANGVVAETFMTAWRRFSEVPDPRCPGCWVSLAGWWRTSAAARRVLRGRG